jgi:hypothetical protein
MCHKGELKQVSYWGLTNIRRHRTKFSCHCNLAPGICAPLACNMVLFFKSCRKSFGRPGWTQGRHSRQFGLGGSSFNKPTAYTLQCIFESVQCIVKQLRERPTAGFDRLATVPEMKILVRRLVQSLWRKDAEHCRHSSTKCFLYVNSSSTLSTTFLHAWFTWPSAIKKPALFPRTRAPSSTPPNDPGARPKEGGSWAAAPQTPQNRNLRNTHFVVTISDVLRDLPFSRNQPMKSADD